jgi:hypothetical protein
MSRGGKDRVAFKGTTEAGPEDEFFGGNSRAPILTLALQNRGACWSSRIVQLASLYLDASFIATRCAVVSAGRLFTASRRALKPESSEKEAQWPS